MITGFFKAVGAVLLLIIAAAFAIVCMYFSYLLGIGAVVVGCIYVAYHIIVTATKARKSSPLEEPE